MQAHSTSRPPAPSSDTVERDAAAFADREAHWQRRIPRGGSLALGGHGVRVGVNRGALVLSVAGENPQTFYAADRRTPERISLCAADGSITLDALQWLALRNVPVTLLDWEGNAIGQFIPGSPDMESIPPAKGSCPSAAVELIRRKLHASRDTVMMFPVGECVDRAVVAIDAACSSLDTEPKTLEALRLIEARAAAAYFSAFPALHWRGKGVEPSWLTPGTRSSSLSKGNRNAMHPLHAILNYAYGVLQAHVNMACGILGLDRMAGVLHARRPNRPSLVFDVMEPLRPETDRALLPLFRETFTRADFLTLSNGALRLHPSLARTVAASAVPRARVQSSVANSSALLRSSLP